MAIRGAKTIAEYAIRRWLAEQEYDMEHSTLTMDGNTGLLKDSKGDSLTIEYDPVTKAVRVKDDR